MKKPLAVDFASPSQGTPFRSFWESHLPEVEGKVPNADGWVNIHCPIHPDAHPSAGVNLKSGVFHCFVCGTYSPYRYLTEVEQLTPDEASTEVDQYRDQFVEGAKLDNWGPVASTPREYLVFAERAQKLLTPDLEIVREYLSSRNLEFSTLIDFGVGYVPAGGLDGKSPGQVECLVFPYYYGGKVAALRGRDILGRKGGVRGSHYIPYHIDALKDSDRCILVEGETDCLRVSQALKRCGVDIPVVATPGAEFRRIWAREFEGVDQIIIIPQSDEPSLEKFLPQAIKALGERCSPVYLHWTRYQLGKDVTDWLRYHSDEELVEKLPKKRRVRARLQTLDDAILASQEEQEWLIEGLLSRGEIGFIAGPMKKGKTYLALNLARAVALGEPFGQWEVSTPGMVLFIEEEGGRQKWAQRVVNVLGEESRGRFVYYHRAHIDLCDRRWLEKIVDELDGQDPDLIIFDPLSNFLRGRDENSAQEMAELLDGIESYRDAFERSAILILAHTSKAPNPQDRWLSIRGSSVVAGRIDLALFVTKFDGSTIHLVVEGKDIPKSALELQFDTSNWRLTPSLRIHPPTRTPTEEKILEAIRAAGGSGISQSKLMETLSIKSSQIVRDVVRKHPSLIREEGEGRIGSPKVYFWNAEAEE
jgi:hypothetical protein